MTITLVPKNWDSFQHYKDRSPAWIKLHKGLLNDFAFSRLPVASRALAPMLWLLASEYEGGQIASSLPEISFRLRMNESELAEALNPLIDAGFFIVASGSIAERKQPAIPEKEREIEEEKQERGEKDSRAVAKRRAPESDQDFEQFWNEYPRREGSNPKKPAREKFQAKVRSGEDPQSIIAGAKRYAAEQSAAGKVGTTYIAHAATWLNQDRWKDYTDDAPATPATNGQTHPVGWRPGMPTDEELRQRQRYGVDDGERSGQQH